MVRRCWRDRSGGGSDCVCVEFSAAAALLTVGCACILAELCARPPSCWCLSHSFVALTLILTHDVANKCTRVCIFTAAVATKIFGTPELLLTFEKKNTHTLLPRTLWLQCASGQCRVYVARTTTCNVCVYDRSHKCTYAWGYACCL